jgi:dihydrofolate reductase
MEIYLIWTQDRQGAIGQDGATPRVLPEDAARFTELTEHAPLIMGKKTWDLLDKRTLSTEQTIVISHQPPPEGDSRVIFVPSIEDALSIISSGEPERCFIVGGAATFKTALPHATRLLVTYTDTELKNPIAFAPLVSVLEWRLIAESPWLTGKSGIQFRYKEFVRVAK